MQQISWKNSLTLACAVVFKDNGERVHDSVSHRGKASLMRINKATAEKAYKYRIRWSCMSRWHCVEKKQQQSYSLRRWCIVFGSFETSVDGCPTVTFHDARLLLLPTEGIYACKWEHQGNLRWIVRPSLSLGFRSIEDSEGRGLGRRRQTVTDEGLFRKEAATVPRTSVLSFGGKCSFLL